MTQRTDHNADDPSTNHQNVEPTTDSSSKQSIRSKLYARRLRSRIVNVNRSAYSEHLRKTRRHNNNFKKMTQKLKQMSRNDSCPDLKPLSLKETEFITNTVKQYNNDNKLHCASNLGKEIDDGHIEFKWKLINPGPDRLQHLITQMKYRLGEGSGFCLYQIGVIDSGHPRGLSDSELVSSISTIFLMAKQLSASISIDSIKRGFEGKVATLSVRKVIKKDLIRSNDNNIRVCVTGNESVGKSTLIGVLTRGKLDDGNGAARMNVFRHRHEIFDGRTSSISHHILGFDNNGIITNYKAFHFSSSSYKEIVKSSTKLITFVDHPGHERYFKTSVFGLTSHKPHYVLLTVSLDEFECKNRDKERNNKWEQMLSLNLDGLLDGNTSSDCDSEESDTDEIEDRDDVIRVNDPSSDYHKYLTLIESMAVPLFIVITKSDIDKYYDYKRLPAMLEVISSVIKDKSHNKVKIKLIETSSEAQRAARALSSSVISYIPIIVTSNVNGEGLQILKTFLFSLNNINSNICNISDGQEFGIDDIYSVFNVGIVTSGIVRCGTVHINDKLSIGPDKKGHYRDVTIKSIHVRRKEVSFAFNGQMASLCLAEIKHKEELRRGMVLINRDKCDISTLTCYSFEAHIDVLNNCTLKENSQPIIHIENIRQSAHILHVHSIDNMLCHGQNGDCVFTFLHYPEFIRCGMKIIIRKSHGPIAIGRVTKLLDTVDKPLVPLNSLQKPRRLRTSKSKTNFKHYLLKWNLEKKNKREKELFSTSEESMEDNEIVENCAMIETQSMESIDEDNIISNKCPIRSRNMRSWKKKKKQYTLVWRSGLGFENFYPKI